MAEKIKGYVKWFSNRNGYGFITPTSDNAPTTDDIFVHQSSIVNKEGEYRTLKEGFETEFEVLTDDTGKLKAVNVTSADGSPCPGPEPRKRRPKKGSSDAAKGDGDAAATSGDDGDKENGGADEGKGKSGRKPRRRNRNGAKKGNNNNAAEVSGDEAKTIKSWENDLDKSVQEQLKTKKITVNGGRAFLAIGDARIKLGTDGYAALAHSKAVLAEGKWAVVPSGVVTFSWERVLKLTDSDWAVSTVDAEKDVLLGELKFSDDSVQPTGSAETTATLWGEDKADPKDALEKHGFSMRKMILNADQAFKRRRKGRGRRFGNKKANGKDKATTSE